LQGGIVGRITESDCRSDLWAGAAVLNHCMALIDSIVACNCWSEYRIKLYTRIVGQNFAAELQVRITAQNCWAESQTQIAGQNCGVARQNHHTKLLGRIIACYSRAESLSQIASQTFRAESQNRIAGQNFGMQFDGQNHRADWSCRAELQGKIVG
jgi:hypothetical protein